MSPLHRAVLLSCSSYKNWWMKKCMRQTFRSPLSSSGLPNLLHLGLNKTTSSHPIPDIPTPAISLFSLKPSTLFKIKGRNHIFSSVFSLPPEWASRAHLWDRAITSPKVWTKMETFRAYLWMWSCFQNIPVFTTSLKEDCNLIHHPETVQNDTAILLIPAGQSVKSTRASSASSLPVHQFLRCTIAHEKFEYLFNFQTWQWKNLLPLSPLHHLHGFWEEATN